MRTLKNESGCRVQMSKNQEVYHNTNERICLVKGKVASCMLVVQTILDKIKEKADTGGHSDPYDLKGVDRSKEVGVSLTCWNRSKRTNLTKSKAPFSNSVPFERFTRNRPLNAPLIKVWLPFIDFLYLDETRCPQHFRWNGHRKERR